MAKVRILTGDMVSAIFGVLKNNKREYSRHELATAISENYIPSLEAVEKHCEKLGKSPEDAEIMRESARELIVKQLLSKINQTIPKMRNGETCGVSNYTAQDAKNFAKVFDRFVPSAQGTASGGSAAPKFDMSEFDV